MNLAEWTGDLGNFADDDFGGGLFRLAKNILEMSFQTEMRRFYELMSYSWKI